MAITEDPRSAQGTEVPERPTDQPLPPPGTSGNRRERLADSPTRASVELAQPQGLSATERRLLSDLFAIVSEHASDSAVEIDRERVQDAFVFACEHHAAQRRKSGEDFIVHPVGVARICAGMRLDTDTLCAALLHDTVEDTSASIEEVARATLARRSPASSTVSPSSRTSPSSRATRRRPTITAR